MKPLNGRFKPSRDEMKKTTLWLASENLEKCTFRIVARLKLCAIQKDLDEGSKLYAYICEHKSLQDNTYVASTLVNMFVKCGVLAKAEEVLKELDVHDVVTWNALIAGYAQQWQGKEALKCYERMQCEGCTPDEVTFACVLKACGTIGAASKGEYIHKKLIALGLLEKDIVLGNTLVDMYVKCGALAKAHQLLEELPVRDVVTWNALIAGYAEQGQGEDALRCYEVMQQEGLSPNVVTFTCVLKACGSIAAAAKGKEIHDKIVNLGMLEGTFVLGNMLVDMYVKCGAVAKAKQVLRDLPVRDVVTWNALIAGYAQQGQGEEALRCYDNMQQDGHSPNEVTFTCAVKACGSIGAAAKMEEIYNEIVALGMLKRNIMLGNTLVDVYAKCGALAKAQQLLKELPIRDVITWNTLIAGYAYQGQGEEALKCYASMQCEGHSPDVVTLTCALKACGSMGAAVKGEQIHNKITGLCLLEKDIMLGNTLVDMYAKCGAVAKAQQVFKELPLHDVVTWNALIAGYVQKGQGMQALKCYDSMQYECHSPDAVTFACALKACGVIGAVVKGEQIHHKITCLGILEKNIVVQNTLVEMYAKCGALEKAQQVIEELSVGNVVGWSVLIAGYAQQGQGLKALNCFEKMQLKGVNPDSTTLICVLNACSLSGLSNQAETFFSNMSTKYGIKPDIEHYSCMVDLLGRAGKFSKAIEVIKDMPSDKHLPMWIALLGACLTWGEMNIARSAFERITSFQKSQCFSSCPDCQYL